MRVTTVVLAVALAIGMAGLVPGAEAQTTCDHLQPCIIDCPTDDSDRPCQLGSDAEKVLAAIAPLLP